MSGFSSITVKNVSIPVPDHIGKLVHAWKQWTSNIPETEIFLGLPAAPEAAASGFIPAAVLTSKVLPAIKTSAKY